MTLEQIRRKKCKRCHKYFKPRYVKTGGGGVGKYCKTCFGKPEIFYKDLLDADKTLFNRLVKEYGSRKNAWRALDHGIYKNGL